MKHIYSISVLLFLTTITATAQKKDFKVFNALLFKDTPDLAEYGFSKINMIYEDGVISTNYHKKKGDFSWRFVDFQKIQKQSLKSKKNSNIPTVLDVEYWGHLLYNSKTKKEAEDVFLQLIQLYRTIDTASLVSVFHYGAISENIYNASNVVYPCYYTHGTDRNEWVSMVKNGISSIKKNKNKMPIYVFIWPQYNPIPSKHNLGYKFVEADFWKLQLETLYPLCDGIIIWSHYHDENGKDIHFDDNMAWFQETVKFMKKYRIK
ncbi:hypothetical protein [Proteiniphilum saccharofermentans]|uniref:hypothetical protein n=1 Tax=Proteiniphilum saccharofermentans TaxID=1642647 RepID=UPI0028A59E54|nr:hypothetical protein [Proteiniphilum saccharofermentans]